MRAIRDREELPMRTIVKNLVAGFLGVLCCAGGLQAQGESVMAAPTRLSPSFQGFPMGTVSTRKVIGFKGQDFLPTSILSDTALGLPLGRGMATAEVAQPVRESTYGRASGNEIQISPRILEISAETSQDPRQNLVLGQLISGSKGVSKALEGAQVAPLSQKLSALFDGEESASDGNNSSLGGNGSSSDDGSGNPRAKSGNPSGSQVTAEDLPGLYRLDHSTLIADLLILDNGHYIIRSGDLMSHGAPLLGKWAFQNNKFLGEHQRGDGEKPRLEIDFNGVTKEAFERETYQNPMTLEGRGFPITVHLKEGDVQLKFVRTNELFFGRDAALDKLVEQELAAETPASAQSKGREPKRLAGFVTLQKEKLPIRIVYATFLRDEKIIIGKEEFQIDSIHGENGFDGSLTVKQNSETIVSKNVTVIRDPEALKHFREKPEETAKMFDNPSEVVFSEGDNALITVSDNQTQAMIGYWAHLD